MRAGPVWPCGARRTECGRTRGELCEQARAAAVCSVRFASREAKPGGKDVPQVRADGHVSMCPVWPQVLKCAHDNLQTADVRSRAAALHTEGVAHARSRTPGRRQILAVLQRP